MKRVLMFLMAFTIVLLSVSCRSGLCADNKCPAQKSEKTAKLRVGFYVDSGSQGGGVLKLARLVNYSPEFELVLLDGKDLREGKLSRVDMLLMPGGSSQKQYRSMQESGAKAVRDFVSGGGAYFGVCAGFHCAMNRPERIKLLPFGRQGGAGFQGITSIEISKEGAELLGVAPGRILGYYSYGPISFQEKDWINSSAKTLAVYKSISTQPGQSTNKMFNAPAIIYGNHGKGKVIATSFHPEGYKMTSDLVFKCINLVTGVKGTPVFPPKNRRPVRVAFYAAALRGKEYVPIWLALDRHADIGTVTIATRDIDTGALDNADVLVIPPGNADVIKRPLQERRAALKEFMDRGGYIVSRYAETAGVIKHKNVIIVPEEKCFVPSVLQVR